MSIGIGTMLGYLSEGDQTNKAIQSSIGKEIKAISFDEDDISFIFTDDTGLKIFDNGQSCCESRYMTTDDDIQYYVGSKFLGADVREGQDNDVDYGVHETAFLIVNTSIGSFTIETHNEHNGYYGGFLIVARTIEP